MRTEQEIRERLGLLRRDVKAIMEAEYQRLGDLQVITSLEDAIGELLWVLGEK
jgi:hypothetical protein